MRKALQSYIIKISPAYIILALIIAFFGGRVLSTKGNFIGGIDVAKYFFWHENFIKEQLLSGSIPLWNPYYYCGHPFAANPQTFIFYPATLLYLAFPLPWAFNIDTILHLYLAAMGIYCFIFIMTESKTAGLAAATVYSFSGYFMDNIFAGHLTMLHSAALMPWVFCFVEKAYKTKRPFFLYASGLILGLQILSGEPQNSYYTIMFLSVYFFIRYFSVCRDANAKSLKWFALYFLLTLMIAAGISAIQFLPSAEFMLLSDRGKNTYEFATFMSFPPQNFFTFLVAKPSANILNTNWEFSGYLGIVSVVIAAVGMVFSKQRPHTTCFGIMLLIAATIMLGSHTPVYRLYCGWCHATIDDVGAHHVAHCARCGRNVTVPSYITVVCDRCGRSARVPPRRLGSERLCAVCGNVLKAGDLVLTPYRRRHHHHHPHHAATSPYGDAAWAMLIIGLTLLVLVLSLTVL